MNNVSCLPFRKADEFRQPFEELTTFDSFGHHVVVVDVLDQVDDPDDVGVAFAAENRELIL